MKIVTTDSSGTTEREVPDDVFTFQEGTHWIACWRYYDVVVQGDTEAEACERLLRNLGAQCMWDAIDGNKPFENVPPPPPELVAEWERRHREAHKETPDGT
jgi:hypothetical protein